MTRFQGRVAIVTGGSGAIGRAIAARLACEGASVLITGRDAGRLDQAAREIPGDVVPLAGDVADPATPDAIVTLARDRWGRIDVLVNNAGVQTSSGLFDQSREEWDELIAILLTGPRFFAQAVARPMVAQGSGSIVNIASLGGHASDGEGIAYGAAKGALINLTRYIAVELGPHGVRANSVSPGLVHTPFIESFPEVFESISREFQRVPLKRMVKTEEVAALVAFLGSDDSAAITGADYPIDAGLSADLYVSPTLGL
jgi:meso-butanediol dehydrogenase/(S,S)-butanediol dehydrogenase/diacetyl reductase